MIDPNKLYRKRGTVVQVLGESVTVRTERGFMLQGWPKGVEKLTPCMAVNIQVKWSICLDRYVIETCNPKR